MKRRYKSAEQIERAIDRKRALIQKLMAEAAAVEGSYALRLMALAKQDKLDYEAIAKLKKERADAARKVRRAARNENQVAKLKAALAEFLTMFLPTIIEDPSVVLRGRR